MLAGVLAVVDGTQLQEAQAVHASDAALAGAAAGVEGGLDALSSRVRGRGRGSQR